ncbi:MAG: prepilin-type N-terminal cleavage/methylation domain-containing protein [Gammaproteobacteria bacterium]|jgi:MSHA biogenesis protein MshO
MKLHQEKGFTLIEVIIVILLIGILSGVIFTILIGPMRAYVDVEKRLRLVDVADTALQRMTREIRLALPNSIRINAGPTIEFLRTLDGGRYRARPGGGTPVCPGGNPAAQDRLNFALTTDCFEVLGTLMNFSDVVTGGSCLSSTGDCLVIYNTGQSGADAYSDNNMAEITDVTANYIEFSGAPPFPNQSPRQRFFIVDTPVSFVCNTGTNQITRHDDYTIGGVVGVGNLLVNQVSACNFSYNPGSASRAGLVSLSITIQDSSLGGGSVTLLQQAHVDNQP